MRTVKEKLPLGKRIEILKNQVIKIGARVDAQEANQQGLIEKIKQEFLSSVEHLKTLIIKSELSSASNEMMSRSLRNCQTEVDAIFYLLNDYDPDRFSMDKLKRMTMQVHNAKALGPAAEAICSFNSKIFSPVAVTHVFNTSKEEKVESGDDSKPEPNQKASAG